VEDGRNWPRIAYLEGVAMDLSVVLERGEEGMVVAHCPALKSCWSEGRTRDEALRNIREAIELYLEADPGELPVDERREVVKLAL
jgi:predicted RNase H-like HicB family nuclease